MASTPYTDGYRAGQEQALKAILKYLYTYRDQLSQIQTDDEAQRKTISIRIHGLNSVIKTIKTRLD